MRALVLMLVVLAVGCGEDCPATAPNELAQEFYGNWTGNLELLYGFNKTVVSMPVSLGVSVVGPEGFVTGLCPRFGGGTIAGTGAGNILNAKGDVHCVPMPFGSCDYLEVIWRDVSIALINPSLAHVTAGGVVSGCGMYENFSATGYIDHH